MVFQSALRTGSALKQAKHQRRTETLACPPVRAAELRLLEDGREDERQCGQRSSTLGSSDDAVCQFCGRFPPVTTRTGRLCRSQFTGRSQSPGRQEHGIHQSEIHARGVGALTPNRFGDHLGGEPSRFLMESLILAQDERWRRA